MRAVGALLAFVFGILIGLIGVEESTAVHGRLEETKRIQFYIPLIQGNDYSRAEDAARNVLAHQVGKSCLVPSIIGYKFISYTSNNGRGRARMTFKVCGGHRLSINNNSVAKAERLVGEQSKSLYSFFPPSGWGSSKQLAGFCHSSKRVPIPFGRTFFQATRIQQGFSPCSSYQRRLPEISCLPGI